MNQHIHVICHVDFIVAPPSGGESITTTLETTIAPAPPVFAPLAARSPERYVKLDTDRRTLSRDATNHAILQDLGTGLEWLVAYVTDDSVPHAAALEAVAKVRVGGHGDWRLPERFELESILDITRHDPAIDLDLFPGTKPTWHWTASPDVSDPACAWAVYFAYGNAALYGRGSYGYVRAVRSVSPAVASQ